MTDEQAKPREWLFVGNFISQAGGKYCMLDGPDLGGKKVWLVERSALEKANAEIESLKSAFEIAKKQMMLALNKRIEAEKERDQLKAEVAELSKDAMLVYQRKIEVLRKTCDERKARIEKLEAALEALVGAHLRMHDGDSLVFGDLIKFARQALEGGESA